jgi:hypothetical protein
VLALAGCGDTPSVHYLNTPGLITQRQVDGYPAGSPERAVAEWGRAVIFSDSTGAARLYAPTLKVEPIALQRQREVLQPGLDRLRAMTITSVERPGPRRATVLVRLRLEGLPDKPDTIVRLSFPMQRYGSRWLLTSPLPSTVQ